MANGGAPEAASRRSIRTRSAHETPSAIAPLPRCHRNLAPANEMGVTEPPAPGGGEGREWAAPVPLDLPGRPFPSPMPEYAHPEVLVSTDWVAQHLADTEHVRVIESNEDVLLYATGHLHNAVHVDWTDDLQDPRRARLHRSSASSGCARGWGSARTRPSSSTATSPTGGPPTPSGRSRCSATRTAASWTAGGQVGGGGPRADDGGPEVPEHGLRGQEPDADGPRLPRRGPAHMKDGGAMVDVRSPQEYIGEIPTCPETRRRARSGRPHPRRPNVPWSRAANEDGTFKGREELEGSTSRSRGSTRRPR